MGKMNDHGNLTPIAAYLHQIIDASGKTQKQIAREVGFDQPHMLSMIKHAEAKTPINKIPALAKCLYVDPAHLFRLAIEQYWPGYNDVIREIFGTVVTRNERALLEALRAVTGIEDPQFSQEAIRIAVQILVPRKSG